MKLTASRINQLIMFKMPIAYLAGIRVKNLTNNSSVVTVKHKWINQNPFNSMYFAVQAMAAEMTTGALVMAEIHQSGAKYSMLVTSNKASFTKKAIGLITFTCQSGELISQALTKSKETGEGVTFWLQSIGINEQGEHVSVMDFEWSIRVKR